MKKAFFNAMKVISAIYCLGYILFDFPNDIYVMRAITWVMSFIFSYSLLLFVFNKVDIQFKKK